MQTHCSHCNALLTPGAPFCLTCFLPFEDEAPAEVPAHAGEPAAVEVPVPVGVGAAAPANDDFFAPPSQTQFVSHPGESADWRMVAPGAAMLVPQSRGRRSRTPLVVMSLLGVLLLVGGFFGAKAVFSKPSDKERFATAFREARPPDFLPAMPDFNTLTRDAFEENNEQPGEARAYVEGVTPLVKAASDALVSLQGTLDRWADGAVSDAEVRTRVNATMKALRAATAFELTVEAPQSTGRGFGKLTSAATDYALALGALLDWMDSGAGGAWMTFRLSVGSANDNWDQGLVNLYRAAGLPTPALPHPPPKS